MQRNFWQHISRLLSGSTSNSPQLPQPAPQRVKCTDCDNLILATTAADNDGLCGVCAQLSPEYRSELREFRRRLAAGEVFKPSQRELESRLAEAELPGNAVIWLPDGCTSGDGCDTAAAAVEIARGLPQGDVFLKSPSGRLCLAFNSLYGVVTYSSVDADYRYARHSQNMGEQIPEDAQLGRNCACCSVGLETFPSRCHMPRDVAFSVFEQAALEGKYDATDWLIIENMDLTEDGEG